MFGFGRQTLALVMMASLAVAAQATRYVALYSHGCHQLNPLLSGKANTAGGHADRGGARARAVQPPCHSSAPAEEGGGHDHASCLICQSFEMTVGFTGPSAPALAGNVVLLPVAVLAPGTNHHLSHLAYPQAQPRAPPA